MNLRCIDITKEGRFTLVVIGFIVIKFYYSVMTRRCGTTEAGQVGDEEDFEDLLDSCTCSMRILYFICIAALDYIQR